MESGEESPKKRKSPLKNVLELQDHQEMQGTPQTASGGGSLTIRSLPLGVKTPNP